MSHMSCAWICCLDKRFEAHPQNLQVFFTTIYLALLCILHLLKTGPHSFGASKLFGWQYCERTRLCMHLSIVTFIIHQDWTSSSLVTFYIKHWPSYIFILSDHVMFFCPILYDVVMHVKCHHCVCELCVVTNIMAIIMRLIVLVWWWRLECMTVPLLQYTAHLNPWLQRSVYTLCWFMCVQMHTASACRMETSIELQWAYATFWPLNVPESTAVLWHAFQKRVQPESGCLTAVNDLQQAKLMSPSGEVQL